MGYLSNAPESRLVLRAEARKSFALSIWITDQHGRKLDLTDTTLRLIVKQLPLDGSDSDDSDNLLTNSLAELVEPEQGYARFNLQASDLDHKSGEYPFAMVLWSEGYSSVIAQGVLDLQPNTEFSSVTQTYSGVNPPTALTIKLRDMLALEVRTGPTLAPGTTSFTNSDKAKLDSIEEGAQVHIPADWGAGDADPGYILNKPHLGSAAYKNIEEISVPPGGSPGEVLVKLSNASFDTGWAQQSGGGGGGGDLDPTGVTAGYVPTANGADGWSWEAVVAGVSSVNGYEGTVSLNLDDIPDSADRMAMTEAQADKLEELTVTPDWSAIQNKPAFGSASLLSESSFLKPTQVSAADVTSGVLANARVPKVTALRGFSSGTAAPSGGEDGDLYFQYTV